MRSALTALMVVLSLGPISGLGEPPPPEPVRVVILGGTITSDHLRDRFIGCPGAHLVSDSRAGNIVSEISPPLRNTPEDQFFSAFCQYLPVDCIIQCPVSNDLEFVLFQKDRISRWAAPGPVNNKPVPFLDALREGITLMAETLKLGESGKQHLLANSVTNEAVFKAIYESRRVWARYPANPGESKLKLLNTLVASNPNDPALASEILLDSEILLGATRRIQDYAKNAIALSVCALPCVLGTPYEESSHAIAKRLANQVEGDLVEHASLLASALDIELPKDMPSSDSMDVGAELPNFEQASSSGAKRLKPTPTSALGALRVLGVLQSAKGLPVLLSASKNTAADARAAVATGLGHYEDPKSLAALQTLETDKNEDVAFAAAHSLWRRKTASSVLLPLARKKAAASGPWRESAVRVLADQGDSQDIALLKTFSADPEPDLRLAAVRALLRLNALDDALRARLLRDGHESVLTTVLASLTSVPDAGTLASIRELTRDPVETIAESARLVLLPARPQDRQQGILFDLDLEHTYIRLKRLDELAAEPAGWATDLLEKACTNRNFYVRAAALPLLQCRDAARGHAAALALMPDPCVWTRFAAARQLAADAEAKDAGVLRKALETEPDASTKLFFQDAIAKAAGTPTPTPPPAAHDVRGAQISTWLCGLGEDCGKSPFSAYYLLSVGYSESMKKAHDAGKIIFGRAAPIGNPGTIPVDRKARDSFWIALEGELDTNSLACLDGLIFGEETMGIDPDAMWPGGWRIFCLDAGIDPQRVKGSMDKLNPYEKSAWSCWAYERGVDGFNAMYDYVKTRLAKRRPGIQVGTFLPRETGATPADARWKFDLGGVYDYKGDNRMAAYNLIRSYKTQWPDRPVLWLSLGIGGYEMNPAKRGQQVPTGPFFTRHDRAYADTVTAWLAGGDAGWFSVWIFVDEKFGVTTHKLKGVQVVAEDLVPGSKALSNAVNYSFANSLKYDDEKSAGPGPKIDEATLGINEALPALDLDADKNAAKAEAEKIRKLDEEKQRFYDGFCFYGQYVSDCARIFNGLPRLAPKPEALAIQPGVNVWTRPDSGSGIPGMALLNEYDFLLDINQTTDLDLSHYRLIVAHSPGAALRDNTIAALSDWLKNRPGLLYVHGALNTNNAAEASTPADHDGLLKNDWPWEADLAAVFPEEKNTLSGDILLDAGQSATNIPLLCSYQILSPATRTLLSTKDGKPVLVLWRKPDAFKGAVLFDAMKHTPKSGLEALRRELNALAANGGVGLTLNGPFLQETLESSNLVAAATTRYYGPTKETKPVPGLDVMSGEKDPVVGPGSSGALNMKDYTSRYLHATPRLVVLAQNPFDRCEKTADGAIVQGKGYFRAATESGRPPVLKPESGVPLAEVTTNVSHWILYGTTDGFANLTLDEKTGRTMTFFRSAAPVKIEP